MPSIWVTIMLWAKALDFIICLLVLSFTTVGLLWHVKKCNKLIF